MCFNYFFMTNKKNSHTESFEKYRPDIDGLRALAVFFVIGFHFFPGWVRGGFIGVDIFFVISGYLISSILFQALARNSFDFADFYSHRIRRIFPALILVLLTCFVVGWFVLLADEYMQLGKHIVGGAGFISNLILWSESGYFDAAAETKPLLHLWSLGIEEQFYIFWPLVLWVIWKLKLKPFGFILAIAITSFCFNLYEIGIDHTAAFYSPQTRIWELLVGSILAYLLLYRQKDFHKTKLSTDLFLAQIPIFSMIARQNWPANALALIGVLLLGIGLALIDKQTHYPGAWAIS